MARTPWQSLDVITDKENNLALEENISDHYQHTRFLACGVGSGMYGGRIRINLKTKPCGNGGRNVHRLGINVTGREDGGCIDPFFPLSEVA